MREIVTSRRYGEKYFYTSREKIASTIETFLASFAPKYRVDIIVLSGKS